MLRPGTLALDRQRLQRSTARRCQRQARSTVRHCPRREHPHCCQRQRASARRRQLRTRQAPRCHPCPAQQLPRRPPRLHPPYPRSRLRLRPRSCRRRLGPDAPCSDKPRAQRARSRLRTNRRCTAARHDRSTHSARSASLVRNNHRGSWQVPWQGRRASARGWRSRLADASWRWLPAYAAVSCSVSRLTSPLRAHLTARVGACDSQAASQAAGCVALRPARPAASFGGQQLVPNWASKFSKMLIFLINSHRSVAAILALV
jgi:hypothetical protein